MYVKLFASIMDSSVWDEAPATKLVWITMLLLADEEGFVKGVERAIARRAVVSDADCRTALTVLESPDIESQNQDYGGRRVQKVEGGWMVLNYVRYREMRTREQVQAADRQKRKYDRDKQLAGEAPDSSREVREVSRSSASLSASASPSAREKEDAMLAEYRSARKKVEAYDMAVADAMGRFGQAKVRRALLDMVAGEVRFTPGTLAGFAAKVKLAQPYFDPPAPAAQPEFSCSDCPGEPVTNKRGIVTGRDHLPTCPSHRGAPT